MSGGVLATLSVAVADDEGAASGLDDLIGDDAELVDGEDAFDLDEEPVEEVEVASGDAADGGDRLGVGEVAGAADGAS